MLQTRFEKPARGLEGFVRFYVQRDVRIRGAAVVHPVPARPTPMIVLEFGDPTDVIYRNQPAPVKAPGIVIVGPQSYRRLEMKLRGALETFVINFQPDGLHRLFSLPMHELTDKDYEAQSVLGAFIGHARERLGNARSFEERVRLVDQFLLHQALRAHSFDGVSAAANRIILAGGRVRIPALADRAGLSIRQLSGGSCGRWACVPSSS